jgi:tRNA modification GTPase
MTRTPRSYTQEDTFELYCHGNPFILKKILSLCLEKGARLAEPGEFTKRAFLNGRMDLSQAEAVVDLIQAKSELQRKYALRQLRGEFSKELTKVRDSIFDVMVESEANIDFPEYVPDEVSPQTFYEILQKAKTWVQELLKSATGHKILKEGFKIVLMGEPNVGKSSLLNSLSGKDLAIVTEVPGTTRDAIEYEIDVKGIPVHLIDTAGLRDPENIVEQKGIEVTYKKFEEADLILWIFDTSKPLYNFALVQPFLGNGKASMMIFNKVDLPIVLNLTEISKNFPSHPSFETSALQNAGIAELKQAIEDWIMNHSDFLESQYMINARHQEILQKVEEYISSAQKALDENLGDDLISSDLRNAVQKLDEILGRSVSEEMVQTIFSRFCIGK